MTQSIHRRGLLLGGLLFALAGGSWGATPVERVRTDLKPLIRAAANSPVQFAVSVPHAMSTAGSGHWSVAHAKATWTYAVEVPTAVSLSFHAVRSSLPAGATLSVRGTRTTMIYRARDFHHTELWSRVFPGQALQFELTVAAADRKKVALNIISLQAGYRSIGAGVLDHPYYRQLLEQQNQATGNASCVTNYQCEVNSSNTPLASATVALIVGNVYQCTGVLINNLAGDASPYVLTARHCETGKLGGGDPSAAASTTVYWDAVSACGATLGSLYDPGIVTQQGAQTVVEQQDAWLILLDQGPAVADAELAGFDASGGAVQGGYTIQHSEGLDKQFTGWSGKADSLQVSGELGVAYLSNFLETVNAVGNIGPGASGGGLIDQNNHLVGTLTLGRKTSDTSGYGSCPASTPPTPNGSNGVADFTALSAVWNSTADTTSSTGSTTLKSVLDPTSTGGLVAPSAPAPNIQLSADQKLATNGSPVILSWNAQGATACTASGGIGGDGWTGALPTSGTQNVTESTTGSTTYILVCSYPGGKSAQAVATVDWVGPLPFLQLSAPQALWTTLPVTLTWSSNVTPCALSGGGLSLTGLAAAGSTITTQSVAGDVTYSLTCGPANDQGMVVAYVSYITPSLYLEATGTDRILGQTFMLQWIAYANTCVPSGGAPNDGWATTAFGAAQLNASGGPTGEFFPNVTTLGTYTYTLTCTSGDITEQQSVTVTFENNAPYVTSALSATSVTYSDSPADYVTLTFDSNMSSCQIETSPDLPYSYNGPLGGYSAYQAQGSVILSPPGVGTYAVSVTCALPGSNPTLVTSQSQTLTVLPPPAPTASLSINPSTVVAGQTYTVTISSTNTLQCLESAGAPDFPWDDYSPPSATLTGSTVNPGQYTFNISCASIDPSQPPATAQAILVVTAGSGSSSSSSGGGSSSSSSGSSGGSAGSGHGGGGAISFLDFAALLLLLFRSAWAGRVRRVAAG